MAMFAEESILLIESMDETEVPLCFIRRLDTLYDLGKNSLEPLSVFSEPCQMPVLLSCPLIHIDTVLFKLVENRSAHIGSSRIDLTDSGRSVWSLPYSVVGILETLGILMLDSFSLLQ